MRNVTVTLDEATARWARIEAARRDLSVSALLRAMIEREMSAEERYGQAMRDFFAQEPVAFKRSRYPAREDLHDRAGLR
jgi:hypothetical protein